MRRFALVYWCFLFQAIGTFAQSPITLSEDVYGTGLPYPPEEYYRYPGNGKYYFHVLDGKDLLIYEADSAAGTSQVVHTETFAAVSGVNLLGALDDKMSFFVRKSQSGATSDFWTYTISDNSFIKIETTNAYNGYYYKASFGNSICFLARYTNNIGGAERRLFRAPINPGSNSELISDVDVYCDDGSEGCPVVFGDALFYRSTIGGASYPLYKTLGTLSSTTQFTNLYNKPIRMTKNGDKLFFFIRNISNDELWASDGAPSGTYKIADLPQNPDYYWFNNFTASCNGKFIFSYSSPQNGSELWVSDGTAAGTHILKDIVPGQESGYPESFIPMENKLIFTTYMQNLWVSDGTENGTSMIKSFVFVDPLVEINGKVFLAANDGAGNGHELWVTDGTTSGTYKIPPPTTASFPLKDINFGYRSFLGKLYFKAKYDGSLKWYKTDGEIIGTPGTQGQSTLSAYPNPVVDQLTLTSTDPCTINISNLSGNILYTFYLTGTQTIDVSFLQAGMYFVSGSNGSSLFFIKST